MSINVRALQEVKDERINEKGRERENKWKRERERSNSTKRNISIGENVNGSHRKLHK